MAYLLLQRATPRLMSGDSPNIRLIYHGVKNRKTKDSVMAIDIQEKRSDTVSFVEVLSYSKAKALMFIQS